MRATLSDIAQKAGVSKSLVSMYLNNYHLSSRIAKTTKAKIDQAVKELGYRASSTARALILGKTKLLGLVVKEISNSYFANFAELAMKVAAKHGYQLLITVTGDNRQEEMRNLENLISRQVDGVLYCPNISPDTKFMEELRKQEYPLLLVDQRAEAISTIVNDTRKAMDTAVALLRKRGHHVIVGLFGHSQSKADDFVAACENCGITADILPYPTFNRRDRAATMKKLCRMKPSAIIVNGHLSTGGLLREISLAQTDYSPDIISSCGYWGQYYNHESILGIVHCHSEQLVRTAIETLIVMVESPSGSPVRHITVQADFVPHSRFSSLMAANPEDSFFADC